MKYLLIAWLFIGCNPTSAPERSTVMDDGCPQTKFKYGDQVRVSKNFYRGYVGTVLAYRSTSYGDNDTKRCKYIYEVLFEDKNIQDINKRNGFEFQESNLELIE